MQRREFLQATGAGALACALSAMRPDTARAQNQAMTPAPNPSFLLYPLHDGWIDNFLLAATQVIVIADANYQGKPELRAPIVEKYRRAQSLVTAAPRENAGLEVEGEKLSWRAYRCADDHLIDLAKWYGSARYVRNWAYVELQSEVAGEVTLHLFTNGPVFAWLRGERVFGAETFDYRSLQPQSLKVSLQAGSNPLLVRFEHLIPLGAPVGLAVRLEGAPVASVSVRLPTDAPDPAARQTLESALDRVVLSRDIFGLGQQVSVSLPSVARDVGPVAVELWRGQQKLASKTWNTAQAGALLSLGRADDFPEGGVRVALQSPFAARDLNASISRQEFHTRPAGDSAARARQTLEWVAGRPGPPREIDADVNMWASQEIRAEIAKMELGQWDRVQVPTVLAFINGVARRKDGSDFRMLELLGLVMRYGENPRFPPEIAPAMEGCALGYIYWNDEPGAAQMSANFLTENHRLAFHTSEILAGQMFPDAIFTNNGKSGDWHREHGEKLTLEWIAKRHACGFEEWDSNGYFAADINILSHLADLARNPSVREGARQVMDILFLSFALNSFDGTFGSTHGRTGVEYIKDARQEPVAGLQFCAWGLGTLGDHADEAVALLTAHSYRVPEIIRALALERPEAMWARERTGLDPKAEKRDTHPVDKVTFKTPDFMLCSAQSWNPRGGGYQQHIWQATLGFDAPVFTTHPAGISEDGNNRPNFWAGNRTLPRVAQWQDTLFCLYNARENDWLGWTHAYFPTFAFDEWKVEGGWAFARKNDGFLALRAATPMTLIDYGKSAARELRAPGRQNAYLCQMGRRANDGNFAAFQAKIRALPLQLTPQSAAFTTPRGEKLEFSWDGPLLRDGKAQPITDFPRFDNPYVQAAWPADRIEIKHGGQSLSLDWKPA